MMKLIEINLEELVNKNLKKYGFSISNLRRKKNGRYYFNFSRPISEKEYRLAIDTFREVWKNLNPPKKSKSSKDRRIA